MKITLKSLALAFLACAVGSAQAGFTSVAYLDGSYDATQPLQNGTVYFVTNSIEITGAYDGKSGLAVAPGAEVVIFVQEDCRLYIRGMDGETGGTGGAGGAAGKSGTGERLNIFPTATFEGTVANDEKWGVFHAPDSVRYVLSFDSAEPAQVYLGKPFSEISAPVAPKRFGKTFNG